MERTVHMITATRLTRKQAQVLTFSSSTEGRGAYTAHGQPVWMEEREGGTMAHHHEPEQEATQEGAKDAALSCPAQRRSPDKDEPRYGRKSLLADAKTPTGGEQRNGKTGQPPSTQNERD